MDKKIKSYEVTNLSTVNTTLYKNGDIFYTDRSIGILHKGKVKKIVSTPDLTGYVKKEEVQDMIPDLSDYVKREEVQQMIDEALNTGGEEGE